MNPALVNDPKSEYQQRRQHWQAEASRLDRQHLTLGNIRLLIFLSGVAVWWFAVRPGLLPGWWLGLPLVVFFALVLFHQGVRTRARLAKRAVTFYDQGVARLEDRWAGKGQQGTEFLDEHHPYAQDLDLFGKGSLFELLCTARTRGGEATLAAWLCAPASLDEVRARHTAVTELRPRLDLRETVALLGEDVRAGLHPEELTAWAQAPVLSSLAVKRILAFVLAGLVVFTLLGQVVFGWGPVWFLAALLLKFAFEISLRPWMRQAGIGVTHALRDLTLISQLLGHLEAERFVSPRLVSLCSALHTSNQPPSRQITRLRQRIALLESAKNQLFIPIAFLLLWDTQIMLAIEAWRVKYGPAIARWLHALGEFEAFCALASYAYEHPHDPYPDLIAQGPRLDAEEMGHPLLPRTQCVRNTLKLGDELRVILISGSNMSGKSTMLRTVGINIVLALAGAPVCARHLRLSPLAIGATLRVQDSLQSGSSRFYAEISRLRQLMDLANGPLPLLFLLDEILHGTNSHDRRIGAEGLIKGFLNRNAIGLVTTHDLALTQLVETLAPRATNVCFEDQLVDGKLVFDYRMRPGIVSKSNALALMRSVGLEV
ncbi:MAG: DNA mismatch repair protein MutS [Deltaproteobacteria bacterium]|nr:DNA mismatch repair protein MutS [Deltaproteobacteria bacterium]